MVHPTWDSCYCPIVLQLFIGEIMDTVGELDKDDEGMIVSCNIIFNLILQAILFLDTVLYIKV